MKKWQQNLMTTDPDQPTCYARRCISPMTAKLAGMLILLVAAVPVYFAWERHQSNRQFVATALSAQATVIDFDLRGSGEELAYIPIYRFADRNGRDRIVASRVSYRKPPLSKGQVLTLLYDPTNPTSFMVPSFVGFWLYICVLGGFAIVIALPGLIVFAVGHRFILERN
ncbi:MAG: DUF3592 domain-containing protein [Sedimentisphaerales bacterium]|nr:DUF3592 domain-containing protein [Sedimentisphaerales bacterium]